jgi:hypothetical protein
MEESKEHQIGKELPGAPEFDGNRLLALDKPGGPPQSSGAPAKVKKNVSIGWPWVGKAWKSSRLSAQTPL